MLRFKSQLSLLTSSESHRSRRRRNCSPRLENLEGRELLSHILPAHKEHKPAKVVAHHGKTPRNHGETAKKGSVTPASTSTSSALMAKPSDPATPPVSPPKGSVTPGVGKISTATAQPPILLPNGTPVEVGSGPGIFMVQGGQTHLISYNDYIAIGAPAPTMLTQSQLDAFPAGSQYVPPQGPNGTLPNGTPVEVGSGPGILMVQGGQTHLISYNDYIAIGTPAPISLTQAQLNAIPAGSQYVPPQGPYGTLPNGTPVEVGSGPGILMVQGGQTRLISYNDYIAIGTPVPISLTQAQLNAIPTGTPYVPPQIPKGTLSSDTGPSARSPNGEWTVTLNQRPADFSGTTIYADVVNNQTGASTSVAAVGDPNGTNPFVAVSNSGDFVVAYQHTNQPTSGVPTLSLVGPSGSTTGDDIDSVEFFYDSALANWYGPSRAVTDVVISNGAFNFVSGLSIDTAGDYVVDYLTDSIDSRSQGDQFSQTVNSQGQNGTAVLTGTLL